MGQDGDTTPGSTNERQSDRGRGARSQLPNGERSRPDQRRQDLGRDARHWNFDPRSNWYRDLVQLVIAVAVGYTLIFALPSYLNKLQDSRVQASLDNCRLNTAQDNVLRALINSSLRQAHRQYPGRDPQGRTAEQREQLAEKFLAPLGGLDDSPAARAARELRCLRRANALRVQ